MTSVVVAGFGPFPGASKNPSADLALALGRRRRPAFAGARIVATVAPTTYAAVFDLPALLAKHNPDLVLFFGLAADARFMRVEIEAVNSALLLHPDAARAKPGRGTLIQDAPSRLSVRAPVHRLIAAARAAGASVRLSRDAGRYICNAALFSCLDTAHRTGRPEIVAFVHIPRPRPRFPRRSRFRSSGPSMATLIRAGEAILIALLAQCRRG